jgi:tetratricopeptide (TPR) repeat protein
VNFGDIDLPTVPADRPSAPGFGELDLPLLAEDAALPGLPDSGLPDMFGVGLPMPAQGAGLPMPAQSAGLPMVAQSAGLPMAAQGTGLPMTAPGAGLPMKAGAGLPMSASAGLPTSRGGVGLPMPAQAAGLPMTADSLPMAADSLPIAADSLPMAADTLPTTAEIGLPSHAQGDGLLPARSSAFDDSDRTLPAPMDGGAAFGDVGIDLADGGPRAPVGSEADLEPLPPPLHAEVAPEPVPRRAREAEPVAKKSKAGRLGVLLAVAAALTGGALTLVPSVGPFGAYFIMDKVKEKSHAAALEELRKALVAQLDEDTYGAASAAIARCRSTRASMPRYAPAAAACAYVTAERAVRFGKRSEDEALARQLLAEAGDGGGDGAVLATSALDTLAGQGAKARSAVAAVVQRSPGDVDAAVLAAEIELGDATAAKAAVSAWSHAVEVHKSARTLFGLARAQAAAGDLKGAEASARAALAASATHSGARILLATLVGSDPAREGDALGYLKEVTGPGNGADAASEAEKVAAFAQLGGIHLGRSRMSAAEQAFAAALKLNPLAVEALIGNGELFYRSGRYSEALARFEAASNAEGTSVVAKVGIAKTFIALERMREAKELLKKLREANPREPLVSLWLGRAEEVLGNRKEAEAAYAEAIKVGGARLGVVDAYVALVRLLSGLGRTDDANAKLAEASKKFPDLPALHRARGELALTLGRYEEARTELEAALAKVDDLSTRFVLGVTLRRMRHYEEASAIFDKIAAVDPDFPGLGPERGVIAQETGQSERALELYRKALEKAPNDVDLKLRIGQTLVMAGHPLDAEKVLEEVRKARPNSAEANHYLGRVLLAKGESLAEATRYLELATQIDPNRAEYHLYVGWAANEQSQSGKAGPALNRALELDRDLGDAYWQRGVLEQKQGATMDALRDLTTALEKRPARFEAWAAIALCDQDLQKWDEAEKAWRKAIAGNDDVAEWHYRLGKLLRDHGNRAAVAAEMEKATTLGERPKETRNAWLPDAHFLAGEALRSSPADKAKAIEHYQRFLALASIGNAYRKEAEQALQALGAPVPP